MTQQVITASVWDGAYTYAAYRNRLDELMADGKTTGPDQSEKMIRYARLNLQRMNRLEKTVEILPDLREALNAIRQPQCWLLLTEGWCGDAAQNIPVIAKAAALNSKIDLRLILRDENPLVMDRYLFQGTRSIPRLIFMDATFTDLALWGPRPAAAQQIVYNGKQAGLPHEVWIEQVHAWYARDKYHSLQHELTAIIKLL